MSDIIIFIVLIVVGYTFGKIAETRHYRSIKLREEKFLRIPTTNKKRSIQTDDKIRSCVLAQGNVVVSIDFFKRAYSNVLNIIGGDLTPYESLLDRARREAILRLKESVSDADEIINLRFETSSISKSDKNIGTIEILAYATAVYYKR